MAVLARHDCLCMPNFWAQLIDDPSGIEPIGLQHSNVIDVTFLNGHSGCVK